MSLEDFKSHIGKKLGTSRWFVLDQTKIDLFANVTEDYQFIHLDADLASKTPFGATIAHGFLTLSDFAEVQYKTDGFWNKDCERSIRWNDKSLNINWLDYVKIKN